MELRKNRTWKRVCVGNVGPPVNQEHSCCRLRRVSLWVWKCKRLFSSRLSFLPCESCVLVSDRQRERVVFFSEMKGKRDGGRVEFKKESFLSIIVEE